jgi:hypothetical protein
MYVARQYRATAVASQPREFYCNHCSYTCDAVVTGIGSGSGQSPFLLDNAGARGRANAAPRSPA